MVREAMKDLLKWKSGSHRNPLIIRGARQVGKTWLMKEFGKAHYEKCAYINFDNNERMESLFSGILIFHESLPLFKLNQGLPLRPKIH